MIFENDYATSRKEEIALEKILKDRGNQTENSSDKGFFSDWDISITATTGDIHTLEVKYNSNYSTGNVVIEICKVKDGYRIPSGLSITKANYYAIKFEDEPEFFIIETDVLKQMVNERQFINEAFKNGYGLAIFDRDLIKSKSKRLR